MSEPEKQVANYLKELGLWWTYESPVFIYDDKGRPRVWTPDFYLPKLGMYVEVQGTDKHAEDYEFRKKMYLKNNYSIIFIEFYKESKWKDVLVKTLIQIEEQRHDEVMKMLLSLKF